MISSLTSCPCCGYATIDEVRGFEICRICKWEDDGQDDRDAHVCRGGPNHVDLWTARTSFLTAGGSEPQRPPKPQPPEPSDVQVRKWYLLDGVAVEKVPLHNLAIWHALDEGEIAGAERRPDRVTLRVVHPKISELFSKAPAYIFIDLLGTAEVLARKVNLQPVDVFSYDFSWPRAISCPRLTADGIAFAGPLFLRYQELTIRLSGNRSVALAALL